jgi:hypothetical protein
MQHEINADAAFITCTCPFLAAHIRGVRPFLWSCKVWLWFVADACKHVTSCDVG